MPAEFCFNLAECFVRQITFQWYNNSSRQMEGKVGYQIVNGRQCPQAYDLWMRRMCYLFSPAANHIV